MDIYIAQGKILIQRNFKEWGEEEKLSIQDMSKMLKIGFIGGGKMAQAMAKGIVSAGRVVIFFFFFFAQIVDFEAKSYFDGG